METTSYYISYTRLAIIFSSWLVVTNYPEVFVVLMFLQHLLYISQQITLTMPKEELMVSPSEQPPAEDEVREPELNKQLRILVTRLATSIMIFAVIR
jgi:hypothetical protein